MNHDQLKEKTLAQQAERMAIYDVTIKGNLVTIDHVTFELTENKKDAFDADKLAMRYSDFFAKFDYLLGDLSAGQLRLTGFYRHHQSSERVIAYLQDYLYEYVSFGAPYFVLEKITEEPRQRRRKHRFSQREISL